MTDRKISAALKKIQFCKEHGFQMEAFLRLYLLNVSMIKFILSVLAPTIDMKDEKVKNTLKILIRELSLHQEMKSVIQKKSLKTLQTWIEKMDTYFKSLKNGEPRPIPALYAESEQVCALLKISVAKVILRQST